MTSATASPQSKPAPQAGSLKDVIAAPTAICTIDGIAGKLIYRGYSIEDLAANTTFEEVVYLLWEGELPNQSQLDAFKLRLANGRELPKVVIDQLRLIPANAHPLAALRSGVSLLAHYDPDSGQVLAGSFMDYALPRADDLVPFELGFNPTRCTTNPLGVKGCGEAGMVGAFPAIANAILDALAPLGVGKIDGPATAYCVWRTIAAARSKKQ